MRDKNLWVFNAGAAFSGNPKWLFLYVVEHHHDIRCVWLCYSDTLVNRMRSLGYEACHYDSFEGRRIGGCAGVYVVDQYKEIIQPYLEGITILNLWHGVGCKTVELGVTEGFLSRRIAKKHIQNKLIYKRDTLFLATSPMMEEHFKKQCDIDDDKIIRAGYPCNTYNGLAKTYDHDILARQKLPSDTTVAVYAPTYRDNDRFGFFTKSLPKVDELVARLEQLGVLLILKLHPQMVEDPSLVAINEACQRSNYLMVWDNDEDFYEIMSSVDVAIVDYSSIFYDLLACGVKRFIRYVFDYDDGDSMRGFVFDFYDMTCGRICKSFDELLAAIGDSVPTPENEINRIANLFWEYSTLDSMERIFERAMEFIPDKSYTLPTLFSFDAFDTLIGRSTIAPDSVFVYVQQRLKESAIECSAYVKDFFPKIRAWGEANCRELQVKSVEQRGDDRCEITLEMIYERIAEVYALSKECIEQMMIWELECEEAVSIPYAENIALLKELINDGEEVIVISDMYLPADFVKSLLRKADPVFESVPIYVSSEYGHQKKDGTLYLDVYHLLDYCYGKWVHVGDNQNADDKQPASLGIEVCRFEKILEQDGYEKGLNSFEPTYDSRLVSGLFTQFRYSHESQMDVYAYSYVSTYFVPYVNWAIKHALQQGIECLYFISRDGHTLKTVADAIIDVKGYEIRTRYIYGSRRAWRVPSQIHEIEDDFFGPFGNFNGVDEYDSLLIATDLDDETFRDAFPQFAYLKEQGSVGKEELKEIVECLRYSPHYHELLLSNAERERVLVEKYLRQEIDFDEKYAFVEFWGRGYTQKCLEKLINDVLGYEKDCIFYYARSIYPSRGHSIRYNYSANNWSLVFLEAVLANVPYASVSSYSEGEGGMIVPDIVPVEVNRAAYDAIMGWLPIFVREYYSLPFLNEDSADRVLYDYGLSYFHRYKTEQVFLDCYASLEDSPSIYGKPIEYAPPWTLKDAFARVIGVRKETRDSKMSLARSKPIYRKVYKWFAKAKHMKKKLIRTLPDFSHE